MKKQTGKKQACKTINAGPPTDRAMFLAQWLEDAKRSLCEDLNLEKNALEWVRRAGDIYETKLTIWQMERDLSESVNEVDRADVRSRIAYLDRTRDEWTSELILLMVGWKGAYEGAKQSIESLPDMIAEAASGGEKKQTLNWAEMSKIGKKEKE